MLAPSGASTYEELHLPLCCSCFCIVIDALFEMWKFILITTLQFLHIFNKFWKGSQRLWECNIPHLTPLMRHWHKVKGEGTSVPEMLQSEKKWSLHVLKFHNCWMSSFLAKTHLGFLMWAPWFGVLQATCCKDVRSCFFFGLRFGISCVTLDIGLMES